MGFADMFDQGRGGEIQRLREEVADIGHNLRRVMDHLGINYERNPLLEISPTVLATLKEDDDAGALDLVVVERGMTEDQARAFLEVIKPRLGLGDFNS
ncbi:MAG: hypothetical protein ACOYD0_11325 [Candidatus Nanopelagicales bacterium]